MLRLYFKRATLITLFLVLVLLFLFSFIYAILFYGSTFGILLSVYYALTFVLIFSAFSLVLFFSPSSVFRDTHRYIILFFLFLVLYGIADIWTSFLYQILPFDNALFHLMKFKTFVSIMIASLLLGEEYHELFYKKATAEMFNILLFSLSFIIAFILPVSFNINLHLFAIMLCIVLVTVFHSFVYSITSLTLSVPLKIVSISLVFFEVSGAFLYTLFDDIVASIIGLSLLLVSFVLFFVKAKRE